MQILPILGRMCNLTQPEISLNPLQVANRRPELMNTQNEPQGPSGVRCNLFDRDAEASSNTRYFEAAA